jgi:hypothetical protein
VHFFEHNADEIDCEIEWEDENETRCTFFIAEERVQECPRITVRIGEEVLAILDTGYKSAIMNDHLYEKIKQRGKQLFRPHKNLFSSSLHISWNYNQRVHIPFATFLPLS